MAHTPGSWSSWNGEINGIGRNAHNHDEGLIAKMPNMSSPKQQANAHLISAAPDLLEACKKLIMYHHQNTLCSIDFQRIEQAIHKAEGEI